MTPADRVGRVALITGAARRIGAAIARHLHRLNYRVVIHYHGSLIEAEALSDSLNQLRPDSAAIIGADLRDPGAVQALARHSIERWGRMDALVNNASTFYPTPLAKASEQDWDDLFASNLKAPFFLSQALSDELIRQAGAIVNIADIHARQPLREHSLYCMAKAGNLMLTKTLARELAPRVRVNGIAPGAILWPEHDQSPDDRSPDGESLEVDGQRQAIISRVPLQRMGSPGDIARLAAFLITDAGYLTGQTIAVDGGKHLVS